MNYQQAELFHEQTKTYGSILGLDTIRRLMYELSDVWKKLKIIHVAGTNGKGSVCCFLCSVLKEAGYKVGQYNSPAVFTLREVYRINGKMIGESAYAECMTEVKDACERLMQQGYPHPTVFEVETAVAFLWFAREKCDYVLLETGMGGATDATNLITNPLCSVFVSVSLDHMAFLGNTLTEIAGVKAGIIKENAPVITVTQTQEVDEVFRSYAKKKNCAYYETESLQKSKIIDGYRVFSLKGTGELRLRMLGSYQVENASLAVKVIEVLRERYQDFVVSDACIRKGLEHAYWAGRFDKINDVPPVYIDGAHNLDAIYRLKQTLEEVTPNRRRIGIMGVMEDKDYLHMVKEIVPMFDKIYTVTPDNPRSLDAVKLAESIEKAGGMALPQDSVSAALKAAKEDALQKDGVVVAFGSLYYLHEIGGNNEKDNIF